MKKLPKTHGVNFGPMGFLTPILTQLVMFLLEGSVDSPDSCSECHWPVDKYFYRTGISLHVMDVQTSNLNSFNPGILKKSNHIFQNLEFFYSFRKKLLKFAHCTCRHARHVNP